MTGGKVGWESAVQLVVEGPRATSAPWRDAGVREVGSERSAGPASVTGVGEELEACATCRAACWFGTSPALRTKRYGAHEPSARIEFIRPLAGKCSAPTEPDPRKVSERCPHVHQSAASFHHPARYPPVV